MSSPGKSTRAVGNRAEDAACAFLLSQGYTLLARNYHVRGGEIDIIAQDGEYIVFVEVRHRMGTAHGTPRETVTPAKQRRILQAAMQYLQAHALSEAPIRFDIVESVQGRLSLLRHAFDASVL